ncbi:hypothetical protein GCM10023353_23440 [Tomitella cavernea]|uniref:Uncharacterized protein n=1 Tax=Tomitella cavernea TaxID=1387982 RepID=A0ABP9CT37_9ACTN
MFGDDHAQDRVAQELKALVGGQAAVLVRERPVGQCKGEQLTFDIDADRSHQWTVVGIVGRRTPPRHTAEVTWRPLYVPQDGQAVCGGILASHPRPAQVTSVGAEVFHWLRRDRVLERDILRLGTATA